MAFEILDKLKNLCLLRFSKRQPIRLLVHWFSLIFKLAR